MTKVYPFLRIEKFLAGVLLAGVALPLALPSPVRVQRRSETEAWRVCIVIGLIPSWRHCWEFGAPKPPAPGGPCTPPTCDPAIQSCPS